MNNPNFDPYSSEPYQIRTEPRQAGTDNPNFVPNAPNAPSYQVGPVIAEQRVYQVGAHCAPVNIYVTAPQPYQVGHNEVVANQQAEPAPQSPPKPVEITGKDCTCGTFCSVILLLVFIAAYIAFADGNSHEVNPCHPGYGLYPVTNQCYKAYLELATFDEASKVCAAANATISTIGSKQEGDDIVAHLKEVFQKNNRAINYNFGMHIGLVSNNSIWQWVDGNKSIHTLWAPGYPRNEAIYRWARIVMRPDGGSNQWVNGMNSDKGYFVCKAMKVQ